MTTEQLEAIRKRSDKASGNWIADYLKMKNAQVVLGDDVPALLAEVERLQVQLTEATSICLWSARRIHPIHKRNMYDWIDELTGEKSERL
jgi:hypothetical protein